MSVVVNSKDMEAIGLNLSDAQFAIKGLSADTELPLHRFIEQEVPFRMRELNNVEVSDDELSSLVASVKENTDVMFDYDKFDGFLMEKFREIKGLDNNKIAMLQGEIHNLRKELDGAVMYEPELAPGIEKRLAVRECELAAAELGVEIDLAPDKIIDVEHLDCFWYNGHIGSLSYKGYTVLIDVVGDLKFSVLDENLNVIVRFSNPECSDVFKYIKNDDELHKLFEEGRVVFWPSHRVEYALFDKDNKPVKVESFDTVLDNNVMAAFCDVGYYKDLIDETIQKHSVVETSFVFDDEIMINDDRQSVNAYLWAVDSLVDRLPSSEHMENINFYADYNVKSGDVKLTSSYDTPVEDGELNKVVELSLPDNEKVLLISELEAYCQKQYSQSCLEFVNEIRNSEGLGSIEEGGKASLTQQIQTADSSKSCEATNKVKPCNDFER